MSESIRRPAKNPADEKITFPCPSCGAKNRFPLLKIHEGPKCGRCKADLQAAIYRALGPVALLDPLVEPLVMKSKIPAFVIAVSARDPRSMEHLRHLDAFFANPKLRGRILFAVAALEECPYFAHRFRLREFPSYLIFKSGLVLEEAHGARTPGYLNNRLETIAAM